MMLRAAIAGFAIWAGAAHAQTADPAEAALAAARQLEQAARSLAQAQKAADRVRALSETIRAYEAGLAAMREGLRRVSIRETRLERQFKAREAEIARLLGVLQTIEFAPPPVLLAHPDGPLGSARAAMMLAEVTPALKARAERLRRDLEEVKTLRMLQKKAAARLEAALAGIQKARAELSKAIADRTDLPRRFTEDPVRTAILLASTETLDGFASGLSQIADGEIAASAADIRDLKGKLPLPVRGVVLRRAGEADAAGIKRPGLIVATRPRALVTTPAAATIRYLGPLLDLGNVVILELQPDMLVILSGLREVYGEAGQVIPEGTPVGLMGGAGPEIGALLSPTGDGTGEDLSETLYIEVRENNRPVDPETWFRTDKNG